MYLLTPHAAGLAKSGAAAAVAAATHAGSAGRPGVLKVAQVSHNMINCFVYWPCLPKTWEAKRARSDTDSCFFSMTGAQLSVSLQMSIGEKMIKQRLAWS